jgi:ubiquinol-cytochrome c reductase cytochrome c1 subunit
MTKFLAAVAALSLLGGVAHAAGGANMYSMQPDVSNKAGLQDGARTYFNYCAGCHSLQYLRYQRMAEDLMLPEAQVMQNFNFTGAKFGDPIKVAMQASSDDVPTGATVWFGKAPPDLSLVSRSRGANWIYSYLLTFYPDPARPMGWNNATFPGASMPHVLWELQGVQQAKFEPKKDSGEVCAKVEIDGQCFVGFDAAVGGSMTPEAFQDSMRSLVSFLEYAGEPAILKRDQYGVWVLLYLILLGGLAYCLKHEFWKDVH